MINYQQMPAGIVGSTKFGQTAKISNEQTFGMYMSDDWLVCYPGYKKVIDFSNFIEARGLFISVRANIMIMVVDNTVYLINEGLGFNIVGTILSSKGDIFIDENDSHQIAICDKEQIYIYAYTLNTFTIAQTEGGALDFTPGYITFQNGYFIAPNIQGFNPNPEWRLSEIGNGKSWPPGANNVGLLQTKPDQPQACIRFPSRGDLLFVMGKTVTEPWQNSAVSYPFPYVKVSSYNIDYGCLNPSTIAESDAFIVWLGSNEKSGPVIMYSNGGDIKQISNDGINDILSSLNYPETAYGFLFSESGHLFYQITFPHPSDNITYTYDFTTQKFYSLMDENRNHHIAKNVVFFNNTYYMISFRDASLYQMSSNFTNYDYGFHIDGSPNIQQIPRERYIPNLRNPSSLPFIVNNYSFPVQMGSPDNTGQIDFSISRNSGITYGNYVSYPMNSIGNFQNRVVFWNLGYGNEFSAKIKLISFDRFVIGEGILEYY